ncbi:MAG: recombinase family protein [Candidatus Pedobacter colombiensis]|uniref:Recombinase family protein n=1 Tax=Candidatus Pedobacter colombiensis TaxID=3121371 RepID=A0AAJ5W5V9_9SPHI|nr:recombinase family protein [Pedobacter sp.]WEK18666.1 MAG: recombinase family protein [Pedobacter sp.]
MKSAYLYVRVSTDEQKRKGYSLPEQEDRLFKYCESNNIHVKGVYREDFSAKNFNRPEWKQLVLAVKKERTKEEKNILFIKWDRFSRNIQYAYEMIGILRKYNTKAMAIDQPVDLDIPESSVMLAVYLSVPEAENTRRALNTANGMRRARQMGRHPNKAPMGFVNLTGIDGKKFIAPKQPEASVVRWIFLQLAKNIYRMTDVRKMAVDKGFLCSPSNFSKLIRNPVYCGLIPVTLNAEEKQMVKGNHEALISVSTFYQVQSIINSKRRISSRTEELKAIFFLTGFLICPLCGRRICGSFSKGSKNKYPYYHCRGRCRTRMNAVLLNYNYERKLQQLVLSDNAIQLLDLILDDANLITNRTEYLNERAELLRQLARQQSALSKARKLFIEDILKFDDYSEFKKEYLLNSACLKKELGDNIDKLKSIDMQRQLQHRTLIDVFGGYATLDTADKKHLAKLLPPTKVNFQTGELSLELNGALSKILMLNKNGQLWK